MKDCIYTLQFSNREEIGVIVLCNYIKKKFKTLCFIYFYLFYFNFLIIIYILFPSHSQLLPFYVISGKFLYYLFILVYFSISIILLIF